MITEMKLRNFKGLSVDDDFSKMNLLTGKCGSGKSARLQAIQWAITGTTGSDTAGNKPTSAAKWCSTEGMSVEIAIGDMQIFRSLGIAPDGGVSHTVAARVGNKRVLGREADYLINEKLGRFMPMWRLSEFTALSPELRRQMILRLCADAAGEPKTAQVVDQIVCESTGPGPDRDWLRRKLEAGASTLGPTEVIAGMTAAIKAAISDARSAADGADAAIRSLADRKTQLGNPAGTVAQARSDKTAVDTQLESVVAQRSSQRGRQTARAELQRMLVENGETEERLDEQSAAHKAEDVTCMMARALSMEQEAEDASAAIVSEAPGPPPADPDVAEQLLRTANERQAQATLSLGTTKGAIDRLSKELEVLESGDWAKALALALRLSEVSDIARDLVALCRENARPGQVHHLRTTISSLQNTHRDVELEVKQAARVVAQSIIDRDRIATETRTYRTRLSEWQMRRDNVAEHSGRLRREASEIRETLGKRADRLAELAADRKKCETSRIDLERRLNEIDSAGGVISENELDAQETALRDRSAAAERKVTALIRASTVDAEMKACGIRAEKANRELDLAKRAMENLKALRETFMNTMLARLIEPIGEFLRAARRTEAPFVDLENANGTAIFEMGWVRGSLRIPMDAMSGGERVLWGAALAYALTLLATPPLRVLLIEAAEVDEVIGLQLVDALGAVADKLDNVFLATCRQSLPVDNTWGIIFTPTEPHELQTAPMGQEGGQ